MRDVLSKVLFMNDTPGANMEDARGEINVMLPSSAISVHFLFSEKLSGISGSSCDSHPTISLSRSDSGRGAGARRAFLLFELFEVRFVAIRDMRLRVLCFEVTRDRSFSSFRGPGLIETLDCLNQ